MTVNGVVTDALNYTVQEDVKLIGGGSLSSANGSEGPDKYGKSGYPAYISGTGTRNTTQTFTAWQPEGTPANVFARDVYGNDYGTNGIWVQGGNGPNPAKIFVNGIPTPPGTDCVLRK